MDLIRWAVVTKSTGSWYTLCDLESEEILSARLKGRIRLDGSRSTNPVVVGDRVVYETDEGGTTVISQIGERNNYIIRRSSNLSKESHIIAANIDQAFLVVTLKNPVTSYEFIDRFLVTAEAYHIDTTLIINKIDLYISPELIDKQKEFEAIYRNAGYEVMPISASENIGVSELKERLKGKVTLFSGNSGVGKSTLISSIDPNLSLRTGEISSYHHRGKHTTTFSEMFPLTDGGYLIDTPGIKGFGLIDIEYNEICRYFPDIFLHSKKCSYTNCTHTHEPDCAVKEAVINDLISESRYESYLKLLDDDDKYRK